MNPIAHLVAAAAAIVLTACATSGAPECATDARYRDAETVAVVVGGNGISVPESTAALHIPQVSREEASAVVPANANRRSACLDFPPEIVAPAAK